MFHRKDSKNPSEIELTTTKKNSQGHFQASIKIENYRTLVQSLMTTSNILPLTQIQDLLNPIMVAQDEIIKNAMKANLAALNKHTEYPPFLENYCAQNVKEPMIVEESTKVFSIKVF